MFLTKILFRILQNASRRHVAPSPDSNVGPVAGVARVPGNTAPAARQVDGPTVPLPPVNARYQPQRPNMKALNRNNTTCSRQGSARTAVGL